MKTKYLNQTLVLMRGGGASTGIWYEFISKTIRGYQRYSLLQFWCSNGLFSKLMRKTLQFGFKPTSSVFGMTIDMFTERSSLLFPIPKMWSEFFSQHVLIIPLFQLTMTEFSDLF